MNAPFKRAGKRLRRIDDLAPIAPPLEKRRLQSYIGLILGDIVAVLIGFMLAGYGYLTADGLRVALTLAQLLLPVFLTVALYNGAYSIDALRAPALGFQRAMIALTLSAAIVLFIAFYTKSTAHFSRVTFTAGIALSIALILFMRWQMHNFVRWRCGASVINELIIEDGGPKVIIPHAITISAKEFGLVPDLGDPHAQDRIGHILRNIDRVVVTCQPSKRAAWAMILKGSHIFGEVIDDAVAQLGAQGARVAGGHGWLLVSSGPLGLRQRLIKRALDFALSSLALIVLAPVLLLVALAILYEDGGPVFFVQKRLGRGNRFFKMYKFRSMSASQSDTSGQQSTQREDARVTRVGRFMRRTSIDELPQLINVLIGDMSLVGPRPHAIGSQAGDKLFWEVDMRYWQRHALKPGLSGLAQVRGLRGATEVEADLANRLQADLEYLENWTILRDIKIILMTLRVVVHDRAF